MADRHSNSGGAAVTAPTADRPDLVRNIALVGPSGSGKTTLVEALLESTGTISRPGRVEDGTTVSDFDEVEHRQQRSIGLALAPLVHDGVKVNLLDTPGYADFVGELRAGLRAADCALFVIAANEGVDGATEALWHECAAVGVPRAVVVTKLDHPRADYAGVLTQAQAAFGEKVLPLYLPVDGAGAVTGLVGLLSERLFDYSSGERVEKEPTAAYAEQAAEARGTLIEGIIEESEDEGLMDRYLGGEVLAAKELIDDLEKAVAHASFFPVLPACASSGLGIRELLEVMTSAFPSPLEHAQPEATTLDGRTTRRLSCDPNGPLLAEVVKTSSDPYVGRISLVRVFSGTLRPDAVLHVSGHVSSFFGPARGHEDHDEDEKVGPLSSPLGKTQRTLNHCVAGDICAVGKLSRAETGDTLSDKDQPLLMRPWSMPEPLLPIAVTAHAKVDEDKLSLGLTRLAAEDPTLRIEHNAETHQLVLWCMGEAHADVVLDRLANRYGVQVDQVPLRVPLRETFTGKVTGHGRHVKQSGGHGQYAVCDIRVEPLPEGSGFEFVDKVVGGAVPRQFIPSVEKGLRTQMERGISAGYPVVDIRVTLFDGKAHSVDSSDLAFQTAGALALREAAKESQVSLLEPVDLVSVLVDDDYVGTVMGDLSSRRGRVLGTEPVGVGRTLVKAELPQIEITRYATDLRSMSHGTGGFTREFARYEPMPPNVAQRVAQQQADET
ncbi:elongation factor G-like protein EF-G2 [Actinopolymorpha alba]|uniref:elongation factor G-like protein EF-G2 n=1 Tax=Actinopolymorpha alba TaxID=533267 RepID=UPI00035C1113|nr:elongation factor G-like protein EF-G2 [Actinopolymorpha alba]